MQILAKQPLWCILTVVLHAILTTAMRLRSRCSLTTLSFGLNISSAISRSCFCKIGMPSKASCGQSTCVLIMKSGYLAWVSGPHQSRFKNRTEYVPSDSVLQLGTCLVDIACGTELNCNWLQLTDVSQTDCETGCLSKAATKESYRY